MKDNRAELATDFEGFGDIEIGLTEVHINIQHVTIEIRIRADEDNVGIIFIGKKGVLSNKTNDYVRLSAGDEHAMPYNNAGNPLYAISDIAGQFINVGVLL